MDGMQFLAELKARKANKKLDVGYIQLTIFDLLDGLIGGRSSDNAAPTGTVSILK